MDNQITINNVASIRSTELDFSNLTANGNKLRVEAVMGTLGSGKTSLICALESQYDLSKTAIIENDLGKADFDSSFLNSCGMKVVALRAGCICCQDLTSLSLSIQEFASSQDSATSALIIEPTGVAHPEKIRDLLLNLGVIFEVTMMVNVKDFDSNLKAGRLKGHFEAADKILFSWWDHMDPVEFNSKISSVLAYKNKVCPQVPFAFITKAGEIASIDKSLLNANDELIQINEDIEHHAQENHAQYNKVTIGLRNDLTLNEIRYFVASANSQGINILRMKGTLEEFSFHVVGNDIQLADNFSSRSVTDLITDKPVPQWLVDVIRVRSEQSGLKLDRDVIEAQERIVESLRFPSSVISKSGQITSEFEADEGWNYVDNIGFSPIIRERFYQTGISLKCEALESALTPEKGSDPNLGYYLKRLGGALSWFISERFVDVEKLCLVDRIRTLKPASQYFKGLAIINDHMHLGGVSAGDTNALMARIKLCENEVGEKDAVFLFNCAYENIKKIDQGNNWSEMLSILKERLYQSTNEGTEI